ncbi:hypothetical protein CEXT_712921 [Caerostris extrusa]|uniref:Uncharacterized protein n=1 Tax=Caerostris extrusa TaxID=172846 RepID=A0AAV4N778_CAEEX|nr:hypothetical protein CEXT_712921 [Caerostris extrusa]
MHQVALNHNYDYASPRCSRLFHSAERITGWAAYPFLQASYGGFHLSLLSDVEQKHRKSPEKDQTSTPSTNIMCYHPLAHHLYVIYDASLNGLVGLSTISVFVMVFCLLLLFCNFSECDKIHSY